MASSSVVGATYSKAGGFTSYMPLNLALRLPWNALPNFGSCFSPWHYAISGQKREGPKRCYHRTGPSLASFARSRVHALTGIVLREAQGGVNDILWSANQLPPKSSCNDHGPRLPAVYATRLRRPVAGPISGGDGHQV